MSGSPPWERWTSPLSVLHRASPLLAARPTWWQPSPLFGRRGLYRPMVALHTVRRMGPVRHALAQRAVCGVVEVHAPFGEAKPKGGPRRR